MKKITNKLRYKAKQRRAKHRGDKQRLRRSKRKGTYGGVSTFTPALPSKFPVITVSAPSILSLAQNPEGTIRFIQDIVEADKPRHDIMLDLDTVEVVTLDAVILLVSQIKGRVINKCRRIGGHEPKNEVVKEFLRRSGFYSHFSSKPESYNTNNNNGYLKKREGKKVREDVAQELIHYANNKLYGEPHRPNKGIYRVLIECMANTRDHASIGQKEQENWWLAVYHSKEDNKVYFAFLDNGVGLFESTRLEGFLKSVGSIIGVYNRVDLLRDIIDGKVSSRTGLSYRGKGLPAIYTAMQRGFFSKLKIISNNVVLDAESREGRLFQPQFRGTCYTWEVSA